MINIHWMLIMGQALSKCFTGVLVIYCTMKNNPKTWEFKAITILFAHVSVGQESRQEDQLEGFAPHVSAGVIHSTVFGWWLGCTGRTQKASLTGLALCVVLPRGSLGFLTAWWLSIADCWHDSWPPIRMKLEATDSSRPRLSYYRAKLCPIPLLLLQLQKITTNLVT